VPIVKQKGEQRFSSSEDSLAGAKFEKTQGVGLSSWSFIVAWSTEFRRFGLSLINVSWIRERAYMVQMQGGNEFDYHGAISKS